MSMTRIRLSEELKVRIASTAERAGKSMHSLILEAIEEKLDLVERRAGFEAEADARYAKLIQSGKRFLGLRCANTSRAGWAGNWRSNQFPRSARKIIRYASENVKG